MGLELEGFIEGVTEVHAGEDESVVGDAFDQSTGKRLDPRAGVCWSIGGARGVSRLEFRRLLGVRVEIEETHDGSEVRGESDVDGLVEVRELRLEFVLEIDGEVTGFDVSHHDTGELVGRADGDRVRVE